MLMILIAALLVTTPLLAAPGQPFNSNFYEVLGVSLSAPQEEIKRAYREMTLRYHPDRAHQTPELGGTDRQEALKRINEAYAVLSSIERRAAYDSKQRQETFTPNSEYTEEVSWRETLAAKHPKVAHLILEPLHEYRSNGSRTVRERTIHKLSPSQDRALVLELIGTGHQSILTDVAMLFFMTAKGGWSAHQDLIAQLYSKAGPQVLGLIASNLYAPEWQTGFGSNLLKDLIFRGFDRDVARSISRTSAILGDEKNAHRTWLKTQNGREIFELLVRRGRADAEIDRYILCVNDSWSRQIPESQQLLRRFPEFAAHPYLSAEKIRAVFEGGFTFASNCEHLLPSGKRPKRRR